MKLLMAPVFLQNHSAKISHKKKTCHLWSAGSIEVKSRMVLFRKRALLHKFINIFCLVFFTVGMMVYAYGMIQIYFAYQSNFWPSTSGIISQSKLSYEKGIARTKGRTRSGTYLAELEYEYSVDGIKFRNKNIFYGYRGGKTSSEAKKLLSKYPSGVGVKVYYQRVNPNHSVLEPGIKLAAWHFPIIGSVLLVVAIFGYFAGKKKR